MRSRIVATSAAAAGAAALLGGCTAAPPPSITQPGGLPLNTAQVIVGGQDSGEIHDVNCTQVGWTWTITIDDGPSESTVVIETGRDTLLAKMVRLRHVNEFSGDYWEGNHGNANAKIVAGTWTVTGRIDGSATDTPTIDHDTRDFTIKTNC